MSEVWTPPQPPLHILSSPRIPSLMRFYGYWVEASDWLMSGSPPTPYFSRWWRSRRGGTVAKSPPCIWRYLNSSRTLTVPSQNHFSTILFLKSTNDTQSSIWIFCPWIIDASCSPDFYCSVSKLVLATLSLKSSMTLLLFAWCFSCSC